MLIKVASKGSAGPKRPLLCLPHSSVTEKKRLEKLSDFEMVCGVKLSQSIFTSQSVASAVVTHSQAEQSEILLTT